MLPTLEKLIFHSIILISPSCRFSMVQESNFVMLYKEKLWWNNMMFLLKLLGMVGFVLKITVLKIWEILLISIQKMPDNGIGRFVLNSDGLIHQILFMLWETNMLMFMDGRNGVMTFMEIISQMVLPQLKYYFKVMKQLQTCNSLMEEKIHGNGQVFVILKETKIHFWLIVMIVVIVLI